MPIKQVVLSLQESYIPEREDAGHRCISVTGPLYKLYLDTSRPCTFSEWIDRFVANDIDGLDVPADVLAQFHDEHPSMLAEIDNKKNFVDYIHPAYLPAYEVGFIRDQATYTKQDNKLLINEKNMKRIKIPIAMVITTDNRIYANTLVPGTFHHSSFSRGDNVLFAAEVFFSSPGVFSSITDKSGHYKPNIQSMLYGLNLLRENGANLETATLYINSWVDDFEKERCYSNITLFLDIYSSACLAGNEHLEFNSIEDARSLLLSSGKEDITCYIAGENDFFEIVKGSDGNIAATSYYEKYKEERARIELQLRKRRAQAMAEASDKDGGFMISRFRIEDDDSTILPELTPPKLCRKKFKF